MNEILTIAMSALKTALDLDHVINHRVRYDVHSECPLQIRVFIDGGPSKYSQGTTSLDEHFRGVVEDALQRAEVYTPFALHVRQMECARQCTVYGKAKKIRAPKAA